MGAIQICANSSEGRNESAIELMEKFNELDKDGNGVIDSQELEKITKGTNYNPEDLIKAADINNDKVLDFREFYNSFKNNKIWKSIFPRPEKSFESDITFYPPLFILIISLIEILFFYVQCKDSIYEKLMYVPEKRGQVWRFITYMLIHQNEKHLFANMSGQIVIGGALEIMNSWWRVALVYLAGGLGGSLWTSIIKPTEMNIGASAGFYALLAGCFATVILNWNEMRLAVLYLFILIIFSGTEVYVFLTSTDKNISFTSHYFGALTGLSAGLVVLKNVKVIKWENKLAWCSIILYVTQMMIAIIFQFWSPSVDFKISRNVTFCMG